MNGWWDHPGDHRWHMWRGSGVPTTISIIEPAEEQEPPAGARRVPFGFARVLAPDRTDAEPLLWEGED